jgi:hypothetical protein
MTVFQLTNTLRDYLNSQIIAMSRNTPMMSFMQPLIKRVINNNIHKVNSGLALLADSSGNIDIEGILTEMLDNLITTAPFTINTSFIGDIEIGGGEIKLNLPFTSNRIVFNKNDVEQFKEILLTKQ